MVNATQRHVRLLKCSIKLSMEFSVRSVRYTHIVLRTIKKNLLNTFYLLSYSYQSGLLLNALLANWQVFQYKYNHTHTHTYIYLKQHIRLVEHAVEQVVVFYFYSWALLSKKKCLPSFLQHSEKIYGMDLTWSDMTIRINWLLMLN